MTDVNSIISPDGHLLVTINGTTVDMGSVSHSITAGDSYLGNIAASIKALMDYNASNGGSNGSVSNSSIALYVSTAGDTQTALDARYASLAQGVLATNAVPKTTTVNGKALSGNISITAADVGAATTAQGTKADSAAVASTTITAGTGLTGGGDLTTNRTLTVSYGTAAGTAAQGNDSRIVSAVPNTRTINTKPLSANVVLAASDITTGVLPAAQLPSAITSAQGAIKLSGDLSGTAASPSVAKVNGVAVAGTPPSSGQALVATSGTAASWTTINSVTDAAVGAVVDQPVTKAKLNGIYVPQSSLVSVSLPTAVFHTDTLSPIVMSYAKVTLGGIPLAGSLQVFAGGLLLSPTSYSLSGTTLTLNGLKAGQSVIIQYAYDVVAGAGPASIVETSIIDNFNRTNSTTTIGNTDTGQPWIVPKNAAGDQPIGGITGNQMYFVDSKSDGYAYVDAGTPDCTTQVKIAAGTGSFGIMVRASDASNGYVANNSGLYQRKNGTTSNNAGWFLDFNPDIVPGDTVRIVCSRSTITAYVQAGSTGSFVSMGSGTDTDFQNNTFYGMRNSSAGTTARFDNFLITANA